MTMIDFNTWKSRCHNVGDIIPKEKGKGGHITKIRELWIESRYEIKNEINSKYLDKGIACESEGIEMLKQVFYPEGYYVSKNRLEIENDFIKGTPDVFLNSDDFVTDIKNAWDFTTLEKAELSHNYYWQLVAYCWLTGKRKARLFYSLNNMPDFLLSDLERKMFYSGNYVSMESNEFISDCEDLRRQHNYDHLPIHEKFRYWEFDVTDEMIETVKNAVIFARNQMQEFEQKRDIEIQKNKEIMQLEAA